MKNISEAVNRIKKAGSSNVRIVPMEGTIAQAGKQQIEIREGSAWIVLVDNVTNRMAEDIVNQASSRLLFG